MHDGLWLAWHASRRYRDIKEHPEKYKLVEETKQAQTAKIGWNYNKIMMVHGFKDATKIAINDETLKNLLSKK